MDDVRLRLSEKCGNLKKIKTELAQLCATDSPMEILAALKDFIQYGNGVAVESDALQASRGLTAAIPMHNPYCSCKL